MYVCKIYFIHCFSYDTLDECFKSAVVEFANI